MQVDLPNIVQKYYPLITGLLLALLSIYYLWVSIIRPRRNSKSKLRPPEVAGSWPIVGHLPQLVGSTPLFKTLANMSDKYGPVFMVRFGMHPTIVVSSWEVAKECFTTNDKFLASRPPSATAKYLAYDHAIFAFSVYGPYWREIRKISTLHLLTHKRLESLKHIPYSEINSCVKTLYTRWVKTQSQIRQNAAGAADDFVKLDMTEMFGHLTLNVVLRFVVGKPIFVHKDNDQNEDCQNEEELESLKLHKTIVEFFELSGALVASDVLPYLGWLDVDGQKKRMKKIAKEMDSIAEKWLEEHRQNKRLQPLSSPPSIGINHDDETDFMAVLLSVLDEGKDDIFFGYNRDTVIKATCLTHILAATDTTSVSLTWALSLLLTNPRVLRKVQDELDTVVGKERNVEDRDVNDLVYLQAVIKETLRLYPAGPLAVPHEAIENCNVGGYEVKAGTRLLVNLWKIHRDPRVWSNPLEFKPERFLPELDGGTGEASTLDYTGQDFVYIPFGSGRRMCPGINFAAQTLHMTLARLLHAFDFDNGLVIDMTEGSGLSMRKVTPLEVHLRPRLPITLY
ncbi:cytochrome P450 CYP82D47-like [Papaver somniferum]|uniref:cytochrome P450 CYP82D47-like n=1 Tax=Papaver somniferum TaxID=3469 RepID=UPI000E6FF611|nr:cytochrome P450 CYP82D47-like [Papaver somniferum]XP_026395581.1 cytochrome P450 CYP82D47-like [Papaver somniferum]